MSNKTTLGPLIVKEIERLVSSKAAWLSQRYGLQKADEDDIRQEGWIAALKALPGYNEVGSGLATYLGPRVAFAMLDSILKAQARGITGTMPAELMDIDAPIERPTDDDEEGIEPSVVALGDLLADPEQEEGMVAVADAQRSLERLGSRERNLLTLYFGLSGQRPMTLADLARRNRQPMSVIYRRIRRGLDMLKDDLEQEDSGE